MTRDEWTRKLIVRLASGHMNGVVKAEAAAWLRGDPVPEKFEPKAKKFYEMAKKAGSPSTTKLAVPGLKADGEDQEKQE